MSTTEEVVHPTLQTGHVGLNVSNLERSKQFYQQVFGFQMIGESEVPDRRFLFLGDGQKLVLTLWQQSEGRFEKQRPGLHHLSFQVANIEQVKQIEQKLQAIQTPFLYDGIIPHNEGARSGGIFFEDPDGIRLEVYSPTGADQPNPPVANGPACGFF